MKKIKAFWNKLNDKANEAVISAKSTIESVNGEGYIDTGVKIIIGVVIGGVILAGLYLLFNGTILPTLETKIDGMFDYKG